MKQNTQNFEEINREFDKEFKGTLLLGDFDDQLAEDRIRLKSFLHTQLLAERERARKEILKEIDDLIAKEILICHKEGTPTSRLTSLAVSLSTIKSKEMNKQTQKKREKKIKEYVFRHLRFSYCPYGVMTSIAISDFKDTFVENQLHRGYLPKDIVVKVVRANAINSDGMLCISDTHIWSIKKYVLVVANCAYFGKKQARKYFEKVNKMDFNKILKLPPFEKEVSEE